MYSSVMWYKHVGHSHVRRKLLSAQHAALLEVTKAYHTVSMDALQVLAGVAPLDLHVAELGSLTVENFTGQLDPESWEVPREDTAHDWQTRWSSSEKG
ncbi:hypothetical protein PR048_004139 [Dryococelus australis]|uniref:Uncharacterized protein n=1 Tax=Dryococelus australis TaxID=614101 RepID=A0ABQ9I4M7_9NEOP|nr:hypothetical protein PR048_004139 [Dryococelus australis]